MPVKQSLAPGKEFLGFMKQLSNRHTSPLTPFAEMSALSIVNSVSFRDAKWTERENRYMALAKQHKADVDTFAKMLGCLTMMLEERIHDAMGEIYMSDEVSHSRWDSDVAFTPWPVATMIAKMTICETALPSHGFFRVAEPAAGTGGMVIAAAAVFKEKGMNFQQVMHVTATEIRATIAHLCYIQLSMLGVPAIVIHGDTLSGDVWSAWRTPMHVLGFWDAKLRRARASDPPPPPAPPKSNKKGQFILF